MGRDKASMVVGGDGLTQARRGADLLGKFCDRTFVSLRDGQTAPDGAQELEVLIDSSLAQGPLSGILAAFHKDPEAAWLVLACDLPFISERVLSHLIAHRKPSDAPPFFAFASSSDGLPEPLCAIYEPSARAVLERHAARGHFCPRHIMIEEKADLIPLPEGAAEALTNLNTPQDLEEVGGFPIHLSWFGHLSELRGLRDETIRTKTGTAGALLHELSRRHALDLSTTRLAVNDEFAASDQPLRPSDKIALLPPFSGG
jgi:molybdopterin-guanine dinucleotide biosynthesis protein A